MPTLLHPDCTRYLHRNFRFLSTAVDGDATTASFRETMRKIEAGEKPFVDTPDPERQDVSEHAFLQDFSEASEAVEVIGQWCLLMVHASLQGFHKEYVADIARTYGHDVKTVRAKLDATMARNWFERYHLFFRLEFGIDWESSPVRITDLEQTNLTRDDLVHNVDVTITYIYRAKSHAERFPQSVFADEMWRGWVSAIRSNWAVMS